LYKYHELQSQLTGGLSIVFSRLAFSGKTPIRPHEFAKSEITQSIQGYDSNSLYLYTVKKKNPCGYFVRYKESENYRPDPCSKHVLSAFQWLRWIGHGKNLESRHAYNGSEEPITK